jgi:glycosyltransferase involved in cell wall biosynthesis
MGIMSIINLGTYPPRQCGIATFSMDLCNSLTINGQKTKIMSVSDEAYKYRYNNEVIFNLLQNQKSDYLKAARYINKTPDADLLVLQHEYGIYGGQDGEYIKELIENLHKPYVLVTHTVLPYPSKHQKDVLNNLCHRAAHIVCMTKRSANLLADLYEAPSELISIIPHGVPQFKTQSRNALKCKHNLEERDIISTFGLIGPGKGLELGIKAIAKVVKHYPQTLYLILGQTHPMLKKYEGEKYRQMLEQMVSDLKLQEYVRFVNRYLSYEEIGEYLNMTDIYLSPYPNKDQAVSGTLSFAMGCGRAIVSTSYAYAIEVLANNRGLLAEDSNPEELGSLVNRILEEPELKNTLEKNAFKSGRTWLWPNIGKQYNILFSRILNDTLIREEAYLSYVKL